MSARFTAPRAADRLAASDDAIWVASNEDGQLYEIDPATDSIVAKPKLHGYVTDLTLGGGAAWVAVTPEDRIYRLNPDDGSVQATYPAGPGPESVAYTDGALIVANGRDGLLSRIDLDDRRAPGASDRCEPDGGAVRWRQPSGSHPWRRCRCRCRCPMATRSGCRSRATT